MMGMFSRATAESVEASLARPAMSEVWRQKLTGSSPRALKCSSRKLARLEVSTASADLCAPTRLATFDSRDSLEILKASNTKVARL